MKTFCRDLGMVGNQDQMIGYKEIRDKVRNMREGRREKEEGIRNMG